MLGRFRICTVDPWIPDINIIRLWKCKKKMMLFNFTEFRINDNCLWDSFEEICKESKPSYNPHQVNYICKEKLMSLLFDDFNGGICYLHVFLRIGFMGEQRPSNPRCWAIIMIPNNI